MKRKTKKVSKKIKKKRPALIDDRELNFLIHQKVLKQPVQSIVDAGRWGTIPSYSSSIEASWFMIKSLMAPGSKLQVHLDPNKRKYGFEWTDRRGIKIGPLYYPSSLSAPKALCMAVLESVGVDIPTDPK